MWFISRRRSLGSLTLPWQHESFADLAEGDTLRLIAKCGLETFDRFAGRLETEPECLMMHGHDEFCSGGVCHLDRLLRRAMRPDPRIVSGDGKNGEIDRAALAQFTECLCECGVAGEKNTPTVSFDEVAVVT